MYAERLKDAKSWGVFTDNGQRIALKSSEAEAKRHIKRLRELGAKE